MFHTGRKISMIRRMLILKDTFPILYGLSPVLESSGLVCPWQADMAAISLGCFEDHFVKFGQCCDLWDKGFHLGLCLQPPLANHSSFFFLRPVRHVELYTLANKTN